MPFCQQNVKSFLDQYLCDGTPGRAGADNNYTVHL